MRLGNPVYGREAEELMMRLKAKGIVLVVVKEKKNIDDVEFSSVVEGDWITFTAGAMAQTALAMLRNVQDFNPEVRKRD